ncbi:enoyl-CoA hydratase/isomerase family protein [Monashia sp. NPDC004114]
MTDPVTYRITGDGVAHVELNRPEAANAVDLTTARALREAVESAGHAEAAYAVLLTGAGKRFCAGGDLAAMAAAAEPIHCVETLALEADAAARALADLDKPVVAAVHGAVAGAGLALMLSCDYIVSAADTKFVFAYPSVGLTPDCGVSYLLPRAIGQQRALQFALSDAPLAAEQALAWGLVTEVVDNAQARAHEVAAALARGPWRAFGQTRSLLRRSWETDRETTGRVEAQTISERLGGSEAQQLVARFVAASSR